MKYSSALFSAALVAFSGVVEAQSLKPGLWSVTLQMQSASGEFEKEIAQQRAEFQRRMAEMPAGQRKAMEDMLSKAGGGAVPAGSEDKVCITKEMIDRNMIASSQKKGCKSTYSPRVGNTVKMSFSCERTDDSGEGIITITGPESFVSKITTNVVRRNKKEQLTVEARAKWVSSSCGSIQPE